MPQIDFQKMSAECKRDMKWFEKPILFKEHEKAS